MANTVAAFADGVGNKINAIQWDGDPGTLANILAWSARIHQDRRGTLCVQMPTNVLNVGVTNWLVMDSHRFPQVFPMTNPQFVATYVAETP